MGRGNVEKPGGRLEGLGLQKCHNVTGGFSKAEITAGSRFRLECVFESPPRNSEASNVISSCPTRSYSVPICLRCNHAPRYPAQQSEAEDYLLYRGVGNDPRSRLENAPTLYAKCRWSKLLRLAAA